MTFINKKTLAQYLQCSYKTACKEYANYLLYAGKKENQKLTIFDLSKIDDLEIKQIKEMIS
jgi:hypothetical protein